MITVAILINGQPVLARSAVNTGEADPATGRVRYRVDDGSDVWHDPADGVVVLASLLLATIREPGVEDGGEDPEAAEDLRGAGG